MPLTPGTRLGPYEVVVKISEGGMGEVYRATDSHLKRAVAIKVLPVSVAADAHRLARFQREAEVLAALNHPNVAAMFFVPGDSIMAAAVHPDGTFDAPRRLFDRANFYLPYRFQSYAPSQDGKRFLMIQRDEGSVPRQINVILNWSGALEAQK